MWFNTVPKEDGYYWVEVDDELKPAVLYTDKYGCREAILLGSGIIHQIYSNQDWWWHEIEMPEERPGTILDLPKKT